MILTALLERWPGEAGIFIHELPGFYAGARTREEAFQQLPDAVEAHLQWLASHGFDLDRYLDLEIDVAEELDPPDGRLGPIFQLDRVSASPDRVEHALRVAALARRDLIDLYRSMSDVRREQTRDAGGWSVADHLRHIAEAEVFYCSALGTRPAPELPPDPVQAMHASADYADFVLEALSDAQRAAVVARNGEEWTASKVLRRMTSHLREHYPWVRDLARGRH